MDSTIPSSFQAILLSLAPTFSAAGFTNFVYLMSGSLLRQGRHTISQMIVFGRGEAGEKHYTTLYRFFSKATWCTDTLGHLLFKLFLSLLGKDVLVVVDDTLCQRSGPHFWGAGMHYDPLRSSYGRNTDEAPWSALAFGHNWVVLAISVQCPWNCNRYFSVPVLSRLYRSKKLCPETEYRKQTELAAEMINVLSSWMPQDRKLTVVGDGAYASKTVLRRLPEGVNFVGPIVPDAAFYDKPTEQPARGRRRLKGDRLRSPKQLIADDRTRWQSVTAQLYGREVALQIKEQVGMWYSVTHTRQVRMVVTRDPRGRIESRAYFATDLTLSVEEILETFAQRWALEVTFQMTKQHLGLEDPQNGWWRRQSRKRHRRKKPGPQPKGKRGSQAVLHTVPFIFCNYGVVLLWYFKNGKPEEDVERVCKKSPWMRKKKTEPSFTDMLAALRREFWYARISAYPSLRGLARKIATLIPEWLAAA